MTRATARQVWAEPSARGVLLLVGYLSMASRGCASIPWHTGCQVEFKPRALGCSGGRLSTCDWHATPWVALGAVNSEDPTEKAQRNKTNKQKTKRRVQPDKKNAGDAHPQVTDSIGRLANQMTAMHIHSTPFSPASRAWQCGHLRLGCVDPSLWRCTWSERHCSKLEFFSSRMSFFSSSC